MNGKRWGPSSLGWDNNVSDHEMCTVYKDTTEKIVMPRGGATAYCSRFVSRSVAGIVCRSLKTKR